MADGTIGICPAVRSILWFTPGSVGGTFARIFTGHRFLASTGRTELAQSGRLYAVSETVAGLSGLRITLAAG